MSFQRAEGGVWILVGSEFSIQNDVFMLFFLAGNLRSHAAAGLWLWIAAVDVVCVMFGLGLTVCGAAIGTKLSSSAKVR